MKLFEIAEKYQFPDINKAIDMWEQINKVLINDGSFCPHHNEHGPCEICQGIESFVKINKSKDIPFDEFVPDYGFTRTQVIQNEISKVPHLKDFDGIWIYSIAFADSGFDWKLIINDLVFSLCFVDIQVNEKYISIYSNQTEIMRTKIDDVESFFIKEWYIKEW